MSEYISAFEFCNRRKSWPKYSTMRKLIKNRHQNGFDKVVWKIGGNFMLKEEDFDAWVETHKNTDI